MFVFWVVTTCGLAEKYELFGGTYCFRPDDGGSIFLRNVSTYL
jgi:hypothetical protein